MKIGITQRVELSSNSSEIRDCLDQNWYKMFENFKVDLIQIPNSIGKIDIWLEKFDVQGIILSGGNDLSHLKNGINISYQRDKIESRILDYVKIKRLPLLGICRGLQLINTYFGGELIPVESHAGVRHELKINRLDHKESFRSVNSYHNWGITKKGLGNDLVPFAWDNNDLIEGVKHINFDIIGIMWHPERCSVLEYNDMVLIKELFGI